MDSKDAPEPTAHAFPLTDIDRRILAMRDEDFHLTEWEELKIIVAANRLEQLKRRPSDLRRYIAWSQDIKKRFGSISDFVVKERLHWTPKPSGNISAPPAFAFENPIPFADEDDFKILLNDWPYGLAPGITHLCVWLKTPTATDPQTGDLTSDARGLINAFVVKTFVAKLDAIFGSGHGEDHVLWFKNWVALQSVRGVDHVHVLIRDAPRVALAEWIADSD